MRLPLYFFLGLSILLSSCGSADLAFINEVKTFEPKWMDLSENFTYVKRNLSLTETRYVQDFQQVKPLFEKAPAGTLSQLGSLESQYKKMMDERDEIDETYKSSLEGFVQTVQEFNTWETRLMKNKLKNDQAKADFVTFQELQEVHLTEVGDLQSKLVQNIDRHNSLMRSFTQLLGVYTSYQIDPK